jgi:hypothetical protein
MSFVFPSYIFLRLYMRNIQTQLYLHTHWKLDTFLYELEVVHTTTF